MSASTRRQLLQRGAAAAAALAWGSAAEAGALPRTQLRALRDAVRGRVLAPGDQGYPTARVLFNTRFDGIRPPAVVRVRDAGDVQRVVRWAARFDVPLVARSGGNAYNGGSTRSSSTATASSSDPADGCCPCRPR